jgi:hypothetical protein
MVANVVLVQPYYGRHTHKIHDTSGQIIQNGEFGIRSMIPIMSNTDSKVAVNET